MSNYGQLCLLPPQNLESKDSNTLQESLQTILEQVLEFKVLRHLLYGLDLMCDSNSTIAVKICRVVNDINPEKKMIVKISKRYQIKKYSFYISDNLIAGENNKGSDIDVSIIGTWLPW